MSFASRTQKTIQHPKEPGVTFVIQKLSGGAYERAQAVHLEKLIAGRNPRGWEATFRRAIAEGVATDADAQKAIADPLAGLDRIEIVKGGLKGWSYTETVNGKTEPIAVTAKAIEDDLDDETLEYLATEIMRLTKPARFQTAEEAQAAQKEI